MEDRINVTHTGALTLVLIVVAVSIGFSFGVQSANAQSFEFDSDGEGDDIYENLAEMGCSYSGPATIFVSQCTVEYGDVDGSTPEQVHYDAYSDGVFMNDTREQRMVERQSYFNQTHGMAMAEAKLTLIQCMNNGTIQSTCEDQAREDINDFYAATQKSIFVSQNRQIQKWRTVDSKVNDTENVNQTELYNPNGSLGDEIKSTNFENRTVELYNGESVNVTVGCYVERTQIGSLSTNYHYEPYHYTGNLNITCEDGNTDTSRQNVTFTSPGNLTVEAVQGSQYESLLQTVADNRNRSFNNLNELADGIYNNYDQNELNYSDTAGPIEMLLTSSTNSNDTGYYGYTAQQAATIGFSVPEKAEAMTVEADFDEDSELETQRGLIFAPEGTFEGDTIETGVKYNASELPYTVNFVIAHEDTDAEEVVLDGEFTVLEMENPTTNETIDNTTVENTDFQTTNTTDLNKQVDDLQEQLDEIENQTNAPESGLLGGNGALGDISAGQIIGGLAIGGTAIIGIALFIGVSVLLLAIRVYTP